MDRLVDKWEKVITSLTSAILFSGWASLFFAYFTSYDPISRLYQFLIGFSLLSLIPFSVVYYFYHKGVVDINVSNREDRYIFYGVSIFSYSIATAVFGLLGAHDLFFISICYVMVTSSVLLVNFVTKISAHVAGSAGPITAICLVFGFGWSFLYIIPVYLVYLRHKQGAHTYLQLFLGFIVSVSVTSLTYVLFY